MNSSLNKFQHRYLSMDSGLNKGCAYERASALNCQQPLQRITMSACPKALKSSLCSHGSPFYKKSSGIKVIIANAICQSCGERVRAYFFIYAHQFKIVATDSGFQAFLDVVVSGYSPAFKGTPI